MIELGQAYALGMGEVAKTVIAKDVLQAVVGLLDAKNNFRLAVNSTWAFGLETFHSAHIARAHPERESFRLVNAPPNLPFKGAFGRNRDSIDRRPLQRERKAEQSCRKGPGRDEFGR